MAAKNREDVQVRGGILYVQGKDHNKLTHASAGGEGENPILVQNVKAESDQVGKKKTANDHQNKSRRKSREMSGRRERGMMRGSAYRQHYFSKQRGEAGGASVMSRTVR